jgi:hypothetical protein
MIAPTMFTTLADASSAASVMHSFVAPVVQALCVAATLVCVFFLINAGYHYMTSSGKPERLEHAKHVMCNALIGLVIVLAAAVLTTILTHAYAGSSAAMNAKLPSLTSVQPKPVSNGLVDILIKAITGLLNNIIQSIAAPFLKALSFFTTSTPLMADNSAVFNLWLMLVGITDVLFVLVVALLGFHVMSAATFGFDEVEFKHLLPRIGLIFLLVNSSIFAVDGVIELSNAMIRAINAAGPSNSVWDVLTTVVKQAGGQGVAALLIMVAFLIFAVILLVYYVGRLVTLYLGAVLSPVVLLLWLVPGFRDFSESAAKVYLTTVFVLFVHVVILELAASLFAGLVVGSPNQAPDTLMAMVVGLATVIALLKTQGVMMQLSYVSVGPRSARKLSGQFMTGVSYLGGRGKTVASTVTSRKDTNNNRGSGQSGSGKSSKQPPGASYTQPKSKSRQGAYKRATPKDEGMGHNPRSSSKDIKTGETTIAPKPLKSKEMEKL